MNLNPFKRTASSPAGAEMPLSDQLAEAEAKYHKISGIANATRNDFSPRKKFAMGQLEAASRQMQRLKFGIAIRQCSSAVQAVEDAMPKAVASCKSRHGQARKAADEAQRLIDSQSARLASVSARLGQVAATRVESEAVSRGALEKATVAGDEAAIAQAAAGLAAHLADAALHDAEVRSLQVQQKALSAAIAEQQTNLKSALAVCEEADSELRDLGIEVHALSADAAILQACEAIFYFMMAGGRLSGAHSGFLLKPGLSKTLHAAGDLTKLVAKDFDRLTSSQHYFGAPHPFDGRLEEDPMALSDGSPSEDQANSIRAAA